MTTDDAKQRIKGYIVKYYGDVRPDVMNYGNFRRELYGYVVSLSHDIGKMSGWQGHNWRQGLRRNLYSFALDEVDRINKRRKVKGILRKVFTLGTAK